MASNGADPWGNGNPLDNPRYYDFLMHRPCGPEPSQADKLLVAHAQGVEQGAAAERARIRLLALVEAAKGPSGPCCSEMRRSALRDFAALLEER